MAAPLPTQDILGVFKALKDDVQTSMLGPRGLSIKSSGTKALTLGEPVSTTAGFWQNPHTVSSKPPRWILQVEGQVEGGVATRFALDPAGQPMGMSRTIGYINNRDGSCAVCAFRVMPAVKPAGPDAAWIFPTGWEYLLVVAFAIPLPAGTSGDPLTDFNPVNGTVNFGGGTARASYPLAFRAVVKAPVTLTAAAGTTYDEVGAATAQFLGATLYDGTQDTDRDRFVTDLAAVFAPAPGQTPFVLAEDTTLVGIDPSVYRQIEAAVNSGKRHIILYGPPGTGKTTLAEYLARELSERDDGDGSYLMLTASSAWSQQDLVGGYQPLGGGAIGFIPGALLRNFDKPAIIDELNRCPIDKVLGPMFSILSGQSSTLPCRVDAADPTSPFHIIHPEPRPGMAAHEHAPDSAWRLICTLNTYDKTQLGQISYALSRRFAWIKVGAPADLDVFVSEMANRIGVAVPNPIPVNPIGAMWRSVNTIREIGGAPIVDFIRTIQALDPAADLFALPAGATAEPFLSAFRMCVLPLMDGLSPREAGDLATGISAEWALDMGRAERLALDCAEFSA
ncbi:5-methylcytosine-specific restriction enzyme B [Bordetella ansorpii]|uniref:5-methylcytosine-specific restriction enzyme B n=1 Tax=Bordetella ansorpii TaxID=288768 RepID=A0A157SRL7_9BORD|nr:AAA family ATPase [Bordetella ansorpii]SAI72944.1 5-methylcytosine-specific restriction enzyme B [Bordetella ansorpii]